ncbi:MAG TPA: hypothetical protein VHE59_12960 [Mucilaginibacter sp.]|nr:hypothetical protein [Mucilaginibacter sp.]
METFFLFSFSLITMKILYIFICLLPLTSVAQEAIVYSKYPASGPQSFFENQKQENDVPGAEKKKLFALMKLWFNTKFQITDTSDSTENACILIGTGVFSGSYTYHGDSPEKSNIAPVNYEESFVIKIVVSDEKYEISLSTPKLSITSVTGQAPEFLGYAKTQSVVHGGQFKTDPNELYENISETIKIDEINLFKNASKYIFKAKKKGLL